MRSPSLRFGVARGIARIAVLLCLEAVTWNAAAQALRFYNVTPCRSVDTRKGFGGLLPSATLRNFTIKSTCGVPNDAKSVALTLTIIGPTQDGFVVVWPQNLSIPAVSNINFLANRPFLANGVVVGLHPTSIPPNPDLSAAYGTNTAPGTIHLVLDVTGYFK